MNKFLFLIMTIFTLVPVATFAKVDDVIVDGAYIRATIPGAPNTAAYMKIKNNTKQLLKFVKATSSISDNIEIHQHTMVNDTMRMEKVDHLAIAENETIEFKPYGYHLMVFGTKEPLADEQTVEIKLHFEQHAPIVVHYRVQGLKQNTHKHHHHH